MWSKPPKRCHLHLQLVLAGVAERRMAEVVGQRDGLGEVGVEAQRRGQRAGDLRHLQRVGQAGAEVVALVGHEDLGLLLQPAEGRGVDDAVAVAGERRAGAALGLGDLAAPRRGGIFGVGRAGRDTWRPSDHSVRQAPWSKPRATSYRRGRSNRLTAMTASRPHPFRRRRPAHPRHRRRPRAGR